MKEKVTIKIPKELYTRLKSSIENTGFSSVTEFVTFVMRTIISGGTVKESAKFNQTEVEEIQKRLKTLGYM
jgi:metal-responsive CopG/Arc/MetJ family transcriptional regulator